VPEFDRFLALSFDCYGTLIDWERGIIDALRPWVAGASRSATLTDEELLTAFSEVESDEESADPARYPEILARVMRRLGQRFAIPVSDEQATAFGASIPAWPAFPDSPSALARLAHRFKLIILSNVDRASFATSNERLGVRFDAIVTAEDVGSYKPDPRNFSALLGTASGLRVTPDQLLHVAQSLYHDHVPAKALGLSTVWIDRRGGRAGSGATPPPAVEVHPDWTFPSMSAFVDDVEGVV
jgi:2-haloalkanoic acid dehalogenase type II